MVLAPQVAHDVRLIPGKEVYVQKALWQLIGAIV